MMELLFPKLQFRINVLLTSLNIPQMHLWLWSAIVDQNISTRLGMPNVSTKDKKE